MRLSGYTHTTSDWKERTSKAKMESVSLMRQTLNDELSDRRKEMADEVEAKARQARSIREAELAVREKAIATVTTRNRKIADTLRHETDVLFHRDLKRANEGKPRATLEDLTTLSKQLSVAMKKQGNDYWIKASPPSARARRRLPPPRSPPPSHPLHSCSTTWTMTALGRFATRSFRAWCEKSSTCRLGWPRMRR